MIILGSRLLAVANMFLVGERAADVGTDHGYLPVYLILNEICPEVIATDRAKDALLLTEELIETYQLKSKIDIRRGDGLKVLSPGEALTISLCGMGGLTMIGIMKASPSVVKEAKRLVLQPQKDIAELRYYLVGLGWKIIKEEMVKDGSFYYQVMALEKGQMVLTEDQALYGPMLIKNAHPLLIEYLEKKNHEDMGLIESLKEIGTAKSNEKIKLLDQEIKYKINLISRILNKQCQ